jgi:hypothetical protein
MMCGCGDGSLCAAHAEELRQRNTRLQEEAAKVEQERRAWDKAAQRSARERDAAVAANTPLVTRVAALEKLLSEEKAASSALLKAADDLCFYCDGVVATRAPPRGIYNAAFDAISVAKKRAAVTGTTSDNNPFRQLGDPATDDARRAYVDDLAHGRD